MRKYLVIVILLLSATAYGFGLMGSGTSGGAACTWSTVWDSETVSGDSTWSDYVAGDRNSRIYVLATDTTGGGSKIRITLKAHGSNSTTVNDSAIGVKKASSDVYDFDSTPTNITFSTADSVTISAGSTTVSDEITYSFSTSTDYIIALYNSSGDMAYLDYSGAAYRKDGVSADETETVDVTSYLANDYIEWLVSVEACN